ncbi:MAG: LysR family transcriptional regulator [Alphaproteobacteria bacterium]|nr:LysR family transcriptional regulator [Alphaproteobacteria bacterium]MCW5743120.1 LysR family transcriptional regulator [Alphaproteobacteria bacterium]
MRFDLADLRLFLHVADAGSLTHGAQRAGLALASASERLKAMEESLGVPLLRRERRGALPTAAGLALLDHARLMLAQFERMKGDLGAHARGLKGRIRVLSNTAAISEHLPRSLAAFLAAHPALDIELEERESPDIVEAIAGGLADIGIVADPPEAPGLEIHPFREDRLVLVVPARHPLAGRRQVWFADALEHDLVGLSHGSALQAHLARHAARLGKRMRLRVRLTGFDAQCRLVEHGAGLAIVPETAAARCRRSMAIKTVRLRDEWAVRQLRICVRRPAALPVHARRLLEHLRPF